MGALAFVDLLRQKNRPIKEPFYSDLGLLSNIYKTNNEQLLQENINNAKYISFTNYRIPEDEDISYEISAHSKIYEAKFYQAIEKMDTLTLQHELLEELHSLYTPEQLENPTDEMKEKITKISIQKGLDILEKKTVWFRIMENYGKYRINIYYDNKYNEANGEDL